MLSQSDRAQVRGHSDVLHMNFSWLWRVILDREKAMAPHSSTLAWKIPWAEEPGGLQSVGSQRVGHDWVTSLSLFTFMSMGSHRVRHDWNGLAAAAAAAGLYKKRDTDQIFLPLKFWKDICIYMLLLFSHVWLFVTPWTVALQASLSMGFPRPEYWSGLLFPSPADLPDPGIKRTSLAWQINSLLLRHQRKPRIF